MVHCEIFSFVQQLELFTLEIPCPSYYAGRHRVIDARQ